MVKHENSSASATTSASFSQMKYTATNTVASPRSSVCLAYISARKRPSPIAAVFTASVSTSPPNFPSRNSHRRTGFASRAYSVRLSISLDTSPTPIKTEISSPISEIALNPSVTMTVCSIPIEICPAMIDAAIITKAKNSRL